MRVEVRVEVKVIHDTGVDTHSEMISVPVSGDVCEAIDLALSEISDLLDAKIGDTYSGEED